MPNFNTALKAEIARVARKELRDELASLRKSAAALRSDISSLRKQFKVQEAQLKSLARAATKAASSSKPATNEAPLERAPASKGSFSPERLLEKRHALGLTQARMAELLGVSSLTVYKWESGQVVPRASKLPEIRTVLALGKRAALARIA